MIKAMALLVAIVVLFGCATFSNETVYANERKINGFSIGMTKEAVMQTMGSKPIISEGQEFNNPYRSEVITGVDKKYEVLYYATDVNVNDGIISDNEVTPVVFLDGKLIGWGWDFMQTIR